MEKRRFNIRIQGVEYPITGSGTEESVLNIARLVNRKFDDISNNNPSLSSAMASILVCLNLADDYLKSEDVSDNLRAKISECLAENERYRKEILQVNERYRKEILETNERCSKDLTENIARFNKELSEQKELAVMMDEENNMLTEKIRQLESVIEKLEKNMR